MVLATTVVPLLLVGGALSVAVTGFPPAPTPTGGRAAPAGAPSASSSPSAPPPTGREPADDPELGSFYGQRLAWEPCSNGQQCADLTVPVDWARPHGDTLKLHVLRHRATGRRQGSLLLNPGGPGGSGATFADVAPRFFSADLVASFDLVGWDPRGVSQVVCLDLDAKAGRNGPLSGVDSSPDTPAELTALEKAQRSLGRACLANTGDLLRHVDSVSTARDLDVLRAALGDTKLTYYGASAGTLIGAWYAQLFPGRVGRLVLDSALDPTIDGAGLQAGQAKGMSRALASYLAGCASRPACPLRRSTPTAAAARVGKLIAGADRHPLAVGSSRTRLSQAALVSVIVEQLYTAERWPVLDRILTAALRGDGLGVVTALPDGDSDFDQFAHLAIQCLDIPDRRTSGQVYADAVRLGRTYPVLGHEIAGASPCREWPVPAAVRPQRLTAVGAAPVLVVGTTRDPATPYEWSQALAGQLSSGRLLTYVGDGHAAYRQHDPCVVHAVDEYLLGRAVPASGTRCQGAAAAATAG